MRVGVPTEIKNNEFRIGLTPAGVSELVLHGHEVLLQAGGGAEIGFHDDDFRRCGAEIVPDADAVYGMSELVVKVKEPQAAECRRLRPGQLLFAYLHLAADAGQARLLQASGATCVAYETVTDAQGRLPLLAPMSEVAGRLAIQAGSRCLEKTAGGTGVLLGGVPGVAPAAVLVIGGGSVGINAARMAMGMGADVTLVDRSIDRLKELEMIFGGRLKTVFSTRESIEHFALRADLVVGAVLVPGAAAPKLISRELVARMRPGSVLVDVAIDQGGCFETSRPTTHAEPTFVVDGVIHYCVANMPGAVARTSTQALTNATLPYVLRLANGGLEALRGDAGLRAGLNVHNGELTHEGVAAALGGSFVDPQLALRG